MAVEPTMAEPPTKRRAPSYTTKQMGDACEMLVAAEMTLAGIPAMKAPDYWPGYDVVAQPPNEKAQRISVKSRTFKRGAAFVSYDECDLFDWLAMVILPGEGCPERRTFIVPRDVADAEARRYATEKTQGLREFRIDEVARKFAAYEGNFALRPCGLKASSEASDLMTKPASASSAGVAHAWPSIPSGVSRSVASGRSARPAGGSKPVKT